MALLAASLLTASPALDAFWARDLGTFARTAQQDVFTQELYSFVTCEPLPPVEANADLKRLLLRLEQARWHRLGAQVDGTAFEDLRSAKFFDRSSTPFKGEKTISWPAEDETWAGEVPVVELPQSGCDAPAVTSDETELLRQVLAREAELPKSLVQRLRFEAAVLALEKGDLAEGRAVASKVDALSIDEPLRFHAALIKTMSGVEGASPLSELISAAPAELKAQLAAKAAFDAAKRNDWDAALKAVSASQARNEEVSLYALLAADRSGKPEQVRAALASLKWPEGADRTANTLRALAVDAALKASTSAELVELQERWEGGYGAPSLELLAQLAISKGRLDLATGIKDAMEKASRKKKSAQLGLELLFIASDKTFAAATEAFLDEAEKKDAGERTAKALARRLALHAAKNPAGWKWFTALVQKRYEIANKKSWQEALALAQSETVVVAASLELPEPPPLRVDWPNVHSLLMLPMSDGTVRSWFGAPEELARAH